MSSLDKNGKRSIAGEAHAFDQTVLNNADHLAETTQAEAYKNDFIDDPSHFLATLNSLAFANSD